MGHRSFFLTKLLLTILMAAACFYTPAYAEKRVALVVGNSTYRHVARLTNPANDAKLITDTLRGLGFTLVGDSAQLDLDKASFDRAVQAFGALLQGADVGLFYYAGHGVQVRGANYLVPVGANPTKEADVDFQMLDVNLVLRQMEGSGTRLNMVVLDACRNNPFGGRGLRATASGLAQMQAPEGTLISFATQPGNVAQDGTDGNSPYTKAFAQTIRRSGLGIFDAFNEVGLAVKRATAGAQQPWVSSSPIGGSFYFAGLPSGTSTTAPAVAAQAPQDDAAKVWATMKDTTSQAVLEAFIRRFGNVVYGDMARARLEELKKSQVAVAAPTVQPATPLSQQNQGKAGKQLQNTLADKYELKILETKFPDKIIHAAIGDAHIASATGRCFIYIPVDVPGGRVYFYLADYVKSDGSKEYSEVNLVFQNIKVRTVSIISGGRSFGMYMKGDSAWSNNGTEERDLLKSMAAGAATEILVDIAKATNVRRSIDVTALQKAIASKSRFCSV